MLSLVWPWALALSPLPLLYRYWRKPVNQTIDALRAPAMLAVSELQDSQFSSTSKLKNLLMILLSLCWLCSVIALARPQWVGEPVALPTSGRDLLLAVDISPSMRQRDMRIGGQIVNRLVAVKSVVGEFEKNATEIALVWFYLVSKPIFKHRSLSIERHCRPCCMRRNWVLPAVMAPLLAMQ